MAGRLFRREFNRLVAGGLLGGALPAVGGDRPAAGAAPADELLSAPVAAIANAIRRRAVSSAELTLAYLRRIEAVNPALNAVVHVGAESAMAAARAADAALARGVLPGPLHGVPMTLKDSFDTAGMVTTCGTLGRSGFVPQQDATVAARLKAAGAVLLGKTNTPELTLSFETDNLVFGRTKNPFDPDRTPGGSSGGAAAAVSASLCAFDIGSDTGGSIRVPAHFCGTAGLKPTHGRVPRTGHVVSFAGLHQSLTQIGPIARAVADLDLLLRVIAGPDGRDPFIAPAPLGDPAKVQLNGLRVAWHADNGLFTPTAEIQAITADAARALQRAGAALAEAIPPLPGSVDALLELYAWMTDGGAWIQRLLEAAGTTTPSPVIAEQINPIAELESAQLTRIVAARDAFRADVLAFMQDYDALVTPVAGFAAPRFGTTEDAEHFPGYVYTQVFNLSGLPAAVLRCGTSPEGLPIGVQVAAQPWREDVALAVARQLEREFGGWQAPTISS
jgi:amidase